MHKADYCMNGKFIWCWSVMTGEEHNIPNIVCGSAVTCEFKISEVTILKTQNLKKYSSVDRLEKTSF